jgi:hypothetical protein
LRLLQISAGFALLLVIQQNVSGQYMHFHKSADGKSILAVYQGDSGWLSEQKDPKSHLHELKTLTALKLVQHDISLAEMRYVATLKQLRSLTIGDAPECVSIDKPAFAVISECAWLESLWICKKDLKDSDLQVFLKLPNLKFITIEGENLCEDGAPHGLTEQAVHTLASIKTLEHVAIRGDTGFTDHSVAGLAKLPNLKSLELTSSRLTDNALGIIASEMKLRELWIESPQFTDKGVSLLKQAAKIEELHVGGGSRP